MSWIKQTISSSNGRKILMSLTGLFLIVFLVTHLIGNLSLLNGDGGVAFNEYAHFMKHNPIIIIGEVVMFIGFLVHIIDGIALVIQNRKARPVAYAVSTKSETRSIASKWMGPLGIILLIFLIVHLVDFFSYKYTADLMGGVPMMTVEGGEIPDLAKLVYAKFTNIYYVIFYVVAMLAVAFHLLHGFRSAFQTLGINHKKYNQMIKVVGIAYSIIVPLAFALIPIIIYATSCSNPSCSH